MSGIAGASGAKEPVAAGRANDALTAVGSHHLLLIGPPSAEADADGEGEFVAGHNPSLVR